MALCAYGLFPCCESYKELLLMTDLSGMVKEFDVVNSKTALDILVQRLRRSARPLLDVISAGKAVPLSVCVSVVFGCAQR